MYANCANLPGIACPPKGEEKWSKLPEEKRHAFHWLLALVLLADASGRVEGPRISLPVIFKITESLV